LHALGNLSAYLATDSVFCNGYCVQAFLQLQTTDFDVAGLPEADLYYAKAACTIGCESSSLCPFRTSSNDSLGNAVASPCLAPQCLDDFWERPSLGCCEYTRLYCNLTNSCTTGARANALAACFGDAGEEASFSCALATGVVCKTGSGASVVPDVALRSNITLNTCLASCFTEFQDAPTGCSVSFLPLPAYADNAIDDAARGSCYVHDTGRCEHVNQANGYLWSCTQGNSTEPSVDPCVFDDTDSVTNPCNDLGCNFVAGLDTSPRCCAVSVPYSLLSFLSFFAAVMVVKLVMAVKLVTAVPSYHSPV
jgi:hypothetical protein